MQPTGDLQADIQRLVEIHNWVASNLQWLSSNSEFYYSKSEMEILKLKFGEMVLILESEDLNHVWQSAE